MKRLLATTAALATLLASPAFSGSIQDAHNTRITRQASEAVTRMNQCRVAVDNATHFWVPGTYFYLNGNNVVACTTHGTNWNTPKNQSVTKNYTLGVSYPGVVRGTKIEFAIDNGEFVRFLQFRNGHTVREVIPAV